ncbi:MAG: tyrosine-type recombinase/integrase [Oscillospiraceae bacterium]|nr:tyrosine-type recombinase/integrase [Oscillospiraceae bacterium]
MENRTITSCTLKKYKEALIGEEKSAVTAEKYCRDICAFALFTGDKPITKELVVEYKQYLVQKGYAVRSVNSKIASLNSFFEFMGWQDCKTKSIKQQREVFCTEEKELTKSEYIRLVNAASNQPRLQLIIKTICGTGIRVSELKYFTVEAVRSGTVSVACKGKNRRIFIPGELKKLLLKYAAKSGIRSGVIFRTKNEKPIDRSNIWSMMKKLCARAKVASSKVFPHNLRKLFARTFYRAEKDIAKLADIPGHSSINTTRIYIISTGAEHRRTMERLGLVV